MAYNRFTGNNYKQTLIELFQQMGYQYECGYVPCAYFDKPNHPNPWYYFSKKVNGRGKWDT